MFESIRSCYPAVYMHMQLDGGLEEVPADQKDVLMEDGIESLS